MANVVMYGIKNCSTVKKAMTWLEEHKIPFQFHDVRKDGLSAELLSKWVEEKGWEVLLNRSGMTFRRLEEADKVDLDAQKAIALILAHPAAMRRPVLAVAGHITVGFKADIYEALFDGMKEA